MRESLETPGMITSRSTAPASPLNSLPCPLSAYAVFLHGFHQVIPRLTWRKMGLHVPWIDIITVADASKQKFNRKHIEDMRIGKGYFDGSVHACIQRVNDAPVDKMIPAQQLLRHAMQPDPASLLPA